MPDHLAGLSDRELVEFASDAHAAGGVGNDALATLYARHAGGVLSLAYRITGSRSDAEDVLHDVFLGLPRLLRSYRDQGRFSGWLKRVAARTALMRMRSERRRRQEPLRNDGFHAESAGTGTAAPASKAAPDAVDQVQLERALARLSPSHRTVLLLKEVEGFSHQEIGALLGISAGTSAVRLNRAWGALRKEMNR